jgi:hypothetical protein
VAFCASGNLLKRVILNDHLAQTAGAASGEHLTVVSAVCDPVPSCSRDQIGLAPAPLQVPKGMRTVAYWLLRHDLLLTYAWPNQGRR